MYLWVLKKTLQYPPFQYGYIYGISYNDDITGLYLLGVFISRLNFEYIRLEMAGFFLAQAGAYTWLLISGRYQTLLSPVFWTTPLWALGILLLFLIPMIARIRLAEYLTHGATLWIRLGVPLLHYCISST